MNKIGNDQINIINLEINEKIEKKEEIKVQHIFWNIKNIWITPTQWAISLIKNRDFVHESLVIQKMDKEGNSFLYRGYLPEVKINTFISTQNKITSLVKFDPIKPTELEALFWGALQITFEIDDKIGEKVIEIIQQDVKDKVEYTFTKDSKTKKIGISIGVCEENENGFPNWAEWVLNRAEKDLEEDEKFHIERKIFTGTGITPKKQDEKEENKPCIIL